MIDSDARPSRQRGATAIEILVTLVVVALGLLGIVGLQIRLQTSEVEAYQRSQALMLLNDMSARLSANRLAASTYPTGADNPLGAGMTCPTSTTTTMDRDLMQWCQALQGAAETVGGAGRAPMKGARGCIELIDGEYLVTVVWQGLTPISAPPNSVACGLNDYNAAGTPCVNDLCRRWITTVVRIANLT